VNAGLDIIRVLSEYYGISAPCFIDNAESCNSFIQIPGQLIRMYVTTDKTLIVK
jgi:hypothetical protein